MVQSSRRASRPSATTAPSPQPTLTPEINWAAVKRRYQHDRRNTVAALAEHYGLDPQLLRSIGRQMGWLRPSTRRGERRQELKPPGTLQERIIALMDGRVTQMEMELQDDHLPPRAECERRSNELSRLIRSLGQAKGKPANPDSETAAGAVDDDQDAWRRELVERIRALKDRLQA